MKALALTAALTLATSSTAFAQSTPMPLFAICQDAETVAETVAVKWLEKPALRGTVGVAVTPDFQSVAGELLLTVSDEGGYSLIFIVPGSNQACLLGTGVDLRKAE